VEQENFIMKKEKQHGENLQKFITNKNYNNENSINYRSQQRNWL